MQLLTNIVVEYLKHNKRIVVPKLGAFIVKQGEGRVMFSELMRSDDGVLRSLLVAYGVNEIEACGMIDRLVFELRHAIANGETFTIEGLGTFSAGDNNTITFRQYREPRSVGGNVRPPFEHLDEAKRSLLRAQGKKSGVRAEQSQRSAQPKRRATQSKAVAEDNINLTKPESYLRGLKYENKKSKGRDEEYYSNDKRRSFDGRKLLVTIVASLILGVAVWLVWGYIFNGSSDKPKSGEVVVTYSDETTSIDTLPVRDSIPMVDMHEGVVDGDAEDGKVTKDQ